jgi:hypothetical protein
MYIITQRLRLRNAPDSRFAVHAGCICRVHPCRGLPPSEIVSSARPGRTVFAGRDAATSTWRSSLGLMRSMERSFRRRSPSPSHKDQWNSPMTSIWACCLDLGRRRRKLRMSGVVDPSSQGGGPMGVEIVSRSLRRGADGLSFSRSAFSGYFPHRAGASMEIQRCGVKPCDAASCPARRCRQFNRKSVFTRRTGTIGRLCRMQTSSNLLWLSRH